MMYENIQDGSIKPPEKEKEKSQSDESSIEDFTEIWNKTIELEREKSEKMEGDED